MERQKYHGPLKGIMRDRAERIGEKEPQTLVYGDKESTDTRLLGGSPLEQMSYSTLKNRTDVMIKETMNEHLNEAFD
jgi:hypothetical protein